MLLKVDKIPIRVTHLIAFILMMNNEKAVLAAFQLIGRLNENQFNYIDDIIFNYMYSIGWINIEIIRISVKLN